jgi:hypothetical protein
MTATAERVAVAVTESDNLCPGCGPVEAPRSFYCQIHIAALWRQVWDHRPETGPRRVATSAR